MASTSGFWAVVAKAEADALDFATVEHIAPSGSGVDTLHCIRYCCTQRNKETTLKEGYGS